VPVRMHAIPISEIRLVVFLSLNRIMLFGLVAAFRRIRSNMLLSRQILCGLFLRQPDVEFDGISSLTLAMQPASLMGLMPKCDWFDRAVPV
jgi:hypothetical protein